MPVHATQIDPRTLGTYDVMDEATWRRIGFDGRLERLREMRTLRATVRELRRQGNKPHALDYWTRERAAVLASFKETIRWRIRQEKRRAMLRATTMQQAAE